MSLFSISAALLGLPPAMNQTVCQRLKQFGTRLLQERGISMRDDSRLIWSYVTGNLPIGWTETRIMDEICLLQYLHQETNYMNRFKSTIPVVKNNIEQQVFAGSPNASAQAYEYTQKFVIPMYRISAMMERHPDGKFPTVWPWLHHDNQNENKNEKEEDEEEEEQTDTEQETETETEEQTDTEQDEEEPDNIESRNTEEEDDDYDTEMVVSTPLPLPLSKGQKKRLKKKQNKIMAIATGIVENAPPGLSYEEIIQLYHDTVDLLAE